MQVLLIIINICYLNYGDYMLQKDYKKYLIKGIIVFLIFYFGAYLQYIPIKLFNLDIDNLSKSMQVILSTFSSICMLIIFIIIYHKDLKEDFIKFKNNFLENLDIGLKYWLYGLIIMIISNLILMFIFKSGGADNENIVQEMLKTLPWLMFINAGIIAPINEEIVFRKTLKDVIADKWFLVCMSFLLFGGAHIINTATTLIDYLYIIPYGALGGAFALAYYKSDTIYTSIFMHMFHNLILAILSIIVL